MEIIEQLVSSETAKLAKEKGFNIHQQKSYYKHDNDLIVLWSLEVESNFVAYAPKQSVLQKWLREKHNVKLFVTFEVIDSSEAAWVWNVWSDLPEDQQGKRPSEWYKRRDSVCHQMTWFSTYEEALEGGLKVALKMLVSICKNCTKKLATHGEFCEFCFDELNSIIKVAEKLYYEANPNTKMDVPSSVYETVEKWALSWRNKPEDLTLYAWIKKYKS